QVDEKGRADLDGHQRASIEISRQLKLAERIALEELVRSSDRRVGGHCRAALQESQVGGVAVTYAFGGRCRTCEAECVFGVVGEEQRLDTDGPGNLGRLAP